jgi:hypothetical protein
MDMDMDIDSDDPSAGKDRGIIGAGIDGPRERRPGVPMETTPRAAAGVHWRTPSRQDPTVEILKRPDLAQLTATFGTAQPPHGLSGVLRRYAYTIPDHRPQHWAVLVLADRVDVVETAAADLVRRQPLVLAAAAGGLLLVAVGMALTGRPRRQPRKSLLAFFGI